jgi:hypothetical protein
MLLLAMLVGTTGYAQKGSPSLSFLTSAGALVPLSGFGKAYQPSLALGTGIEYAFGQHYFVQLTADINAVRYNQQIKDDAAGYLFQNTKSAVLLGGLQIGRNIWIGQQQKIFVSPYIGGGYLSIGEPRLSLDPVTHIIRQSVSRKGGVFGRGGIRLAYKTTSKVLQTLYVDMAYWRSPIHIQNAQPQALALSLGTRFGF